MKREVGALLLDIEGTTTPVAFVYEVLFPFARRHMQDFIPRNFARADIRRDLEELRVECEKDRKQGHNPPEWRDEIDSSVAYMHWLMDHDRKSTALKSLQGKIWEAGYRAEELEGDVYDDVPRAFARWRDEGRRIAIFSSGSVLAQQLLFAHSNKGDLSRFIAAYFDTTTGPKNQAESYKRIAHAMGFLPAEILFCSDVAAELDAAHRAGLQTALCVREGEGPVGAAHPVTHTFDEL